MNEEQLVAWITSLTRDNNIHAFYVSTAWKHIREEVLQEQNYECQVCKSQGKYTLANTVHHIKYLKRHPALALTKENLLAVCKDCHDMIHKKYNIKQQLNEEKW